MLSDTFLCWFLCLFWIIVLMEDPITAKYKFSSRGCWVLIFYLLVFARIHDTMYLNKMSRTSSKKIKNRPCLKTEYAGVCFWMSEEDSSRNPPKQHVLFDFFYFRLSDSKTQLISAILHLWSLASLWQLKLSSSPSIKAI